MNTSAIEIIGLTKRFPRRGAWRDFFVPAADEDSSGPSVLNGIDLEIAAGEIFGLIGANGAGKTTLVEIIAAQLLPSSGQVRICGQDAVRDAQRVRSLIGYCPAAADSFFPRLSALENLEFFAQLYDVPRPSARARELLGRVGLQADSRKSFQQFSLGMKQRLGVARALLANPPVLVLDEPTRSLDPLMQRETHQLLRECVGSGQSKTILLVTHSFADVEAVCDRMAIMSHGRIAVSGSPGQVQSAAQTNSLVEAFAHFTGHNIEVAEAGLESGVRP